MYSMIFHILYPHESGPMGGAPCTGLRLGVGQYSRYQYGGTPLNVHPSMADTCDMMDISECPDCISIDFNIHVYIQTPSTADTPLFRITDTYFGPVQAWGIVNTSHNR